MRAFDVDPAGTSDMLAIFYLHLRQFDESRRFIELANSANRVAAAVPEAWGLFSGSGEVQRARDVLERALSRSPNADARVLGLLARLEWFDGRLPGGDTRREGDTTASTTPFPCPPKPPTSHGLRSAFGRSDA